MIWETLGLDDRSSNLVGIHPDHRGLDRRLRPSRCPPWQQVEKSAPAAKEAPAEGGAKSSRAHGRAKKRAPLSGAEEATRRRGGPLVVVVSAISNRG